MSLHIITRNSIMEGSNPFTIPLKFPPHIFVGRFCIGKE